jgi:hypothetical protein
LGAHAAVVVGAGAVAAARVAAVEGAVVSVAVRRAVECPAAGARADVQEAAPQTWRGAAVADDPMSAVAEADRGQTLEVREADARGSPIAVPRSVVPAEGLAGGAAASAAGRALAALVVPAVSAVSAVGRDSQEASVADPDSAAVSVVSPDSVAVLAAGQV